METFIAIIHALTALSLIALVLLQDSKSDGLGGAFGGGGSNSILGATGGATLAQKLTRAAAVIFAITSLTLTTLSNKRTSVVDQLPSTPATAPTTTGSETAPATPSAAPEAPATQPAPAQ